ncbi:hypothetical protein OG234_13590 [Streptomyces sp. NBC_01420]|uniref:hypothetical protein n=1 Tax=Streptomyces sp. NBC_01420 TaxID=2903858 RepID=UPI003243BA5F
MMTDTSETTLQIPAWTAGNEDCPDCDCCTAALCARGRVRVHCCAGSAPAECKTTVYGCPCSSRLTRGTHAWRAERHRATVQATQDPLPPAAEAVLNRVATRDLTNDLDLGMLAVLRVAGFVAELADELFVLTELGAYYLTVRAGTRYPVSVEVLSVDRPTRTAQVLVGAWHADRPVTVLLDQLLVDAEMPAEQLPGLWLDAEANPDVADPDDLVLTRVRVASGMPADLVPVPAPGVPDAD